MGIIFKILNVVFIIVITIWIIGLIKVNQEVINKCIDLFEEDICGIESCYANYGFPSSKYQRQYQNCLLKEIFKEASQT